MRSIGDVEGVRGLASSIVRTKEASSFGSAGRYLSLVPSFVIVSS